MSEDQALPSWRHKLRAIVGQFRELEGKHPGLWPVAPRLLCGAAMSVAVVVASWWFIWTAQWEALSSGQAEVEQQKQAFELKVHQAQSLDVLREQKIRVQAQVQKLEQQLPSRAEMDALLSDINRAGVSRGLQFDLFKPGQVRLHEYYAELPIDIKLNGSYHALAGFTSDVAHLPRIVTLDKLVITSQREGTQSFEAVARTFRYLDKDEVALRKKQIADSKSKESK